MLEEHSASSPGITSALDSHQHRCSHLPKNNKKSFSHLATLKHNLAPKNLQGCPTPTFYHSWCQWSSRPIRCWKPPLDLPGLRHKDKWCYQIKCLLMACRETKEGSFTRSHMYISIVIFPNEAHLEPVCEFLWLIHWQPWWEKCLVCIGTDFFFFFLKTWFSNVNIIQLQCRCAARISGHVTMWSHILQLCILWTMGNIYWPQVAKKNSKRKTTYAEGSLYLNTHLDWLLNFAHHSKDCWSHLRSQYKVVALETRVSKEGEGRMLYAVWFCAVALGNLDLMLCFCFIHVCTDVCDHSAIVRLLRVFCVVLHQVMEWPARSNGLLSVN